MSTEERMSWIDSDVEVSPGEHTFEYNGRVYGYDGELTEETVLSVDGAATTLTLGRLIAMTNGDVLSALPGPATGLPGPDAPTGFGVFAVPSMGDSVHDVSTEATAHMTMLYFGDGEATDAELEEVLEAVRAETRGVGPVEARVTGRGELGDDRADVLLVEPGELHAVRDRLLKHAVVQRLLDRAHQYPQWTPHITVGYPERPARGQTPRTVLFDSVEVWRGPDHHAVELDPDPVDAELYASGVRGSGFEVLGRGTKASLVASATSGALLGDHGLGRGFDALVASGQYPHRALLAMAVTRAGAIYGAPVVSAAEAERWADGLPLAEANTLRYDEAAIEYARSAT